MIIWINGAFGSGKTQTANMLHGRLPNSYVYDPENVGYFIRENVPDSLRQPDFQDFPLWREFNYEMLAYIARRFDGVILAPMTLVNPEYFNAIISRLREQGFRVHHYALCASKETLLRRLQSRGDGPQSWAAQQIDRCIACLTNPAFNELLNTDNWTIEDNVDYIAKASGLAL